MPPFAQFRVWMREGPLSERILTGVVVAVALALVGLALVPVHDHGGNSAVASVASGATQGGVTPGTNGTTGGAAGGPAPGVAVQDGTSAAIGGPTASSPGGSGAGASPAAIPASGSSVPPGAPAATSAPSTPGCGTRAASGPGVSATQVHIDFAEVDLAGPVGNSVFGIRPDIPQVVNAVVDHINKSGGVACGRQLVVTQYGVNPIDSNDEQSKCLQMTGNNALAVMNDAGYVTPVSEECFPQHHLPLETGTSIGKQQGASSYPYLFSPLDTSEQQVRDGILGAAARGYFKAPKFSGKLGLFEDNCLPAANQEISRDLAASGVQSNQISTFVIDCALIGSPSAISQAVIQNKVAGDTEVFLASSISNDQNYVKDADQQNFHPQYLTSDYGSPEAEGQTWDGGFDGAVVITSTRTGEIDSGIHSPAETTCNNILVSHGIKPITSGATDGGATLICDLLFMFVQAVNHAGTNPTRAGLVESLGTMGYFHSAEIGDANWATPGRITGGDFERAALFHAACQCFKVTEPSFGPAY